MKLREMPFPYRAALIADIAKGLGISPE